MSFSVPLLVCSPLNVSVFLSLYPSVGSSVHVSVCSSDNLLVCLPVCVSVCSFVRLLIYLSVRLSFWMSARLSVHLFICSVLSNLRFSVYECISMLSCLSVYWLVCLSTSLDISQANEGIKLKFSDYAQKSLTLKYHLIFSWTLCQRSQLINHHQF